MNGIEKPIARDAGNRFPYRGRFAPTPSGPLHLGSLLTALASYLQARQAGGAWLLRLDDLDAQRCRPEHADTILRQLEAHGLLWDEAPRRQREHVAAYEAALDALARTARVYRCDCTRARLAAESRPGPDGPVYAGTCRARAVTAPVAALRIALADGTLRLHDPWLGDVERDLQQDLGDFVLKRADGAIGYQLACVVDEAAQVITEVVRGRDLIGSTMRQIALQRMLGLATPQYRHLPLLVDAEGRKLSKQNHAAPVDAAHTVRNLQHCLVLLGQSPPEALARTSVREVLDWACRHWEPGRLPRVASLPVRA